MSERRDAYVERLKARLDRWNKKIDEVEERAQKVGSDSRAEAEKQLNNIRAKRAELEERIEHVRKEGDGAWKDLRRGVKSSWRALDKAVRQAASKFKQPPMKSA